MRRSGFGLRVLLSGLSVYFLLLSVLLVWFSRRSLFGGRWLRSHFHIHLFARDSVLLWVLQIGLARMLTVSFVVFYLITRLNQIFLAWGLTIYVAFVHLNTFVKLSATLWLHSLVGLALLIEITLLLDIRVFLLKMTSGPMIEVVIAS